MENKLKIQITPNDGIVEAESRRMQTVYREDNVGEALRAILEGLNDLAYTYPQAIIGQLDSGFSEFLRIASICHRVRTLDRELADRNPSTAEIADLGDIRRAFPIGWPRAMAGRNLVRISGMPEVTP